MEIETSAAYSLRHLEDETPNYWELIYQELEKGNAILREINENMKQAIRDMEASK